MESSQQNTKRTNGHEVNSLCQTHQSFVLFANKLIHVDDDYNRKEAFVCNLLLAYQS